jgi:hypothetical protein
MNHVIIKKALLNKQGFLIFIVRLIRESKVQGLLYTGS